MSQTPTSTPSTSVPPAPSATPSSTSAPPSSATPNSFDATLEDVHSIVLPESCATGAGKKLDQGRLEVDGVTVSITEVPPVFADLNGDGSKEGVAWLQCVQNAPLLVLVGKGAKLLDALDVASAVEAGFASPESLTIKGPTVVASFHGMHTRGALGLLHVATVSAPDGKLMARYNDPLEGAQMTTDGFGPIMWGHSAKQVEYAGWGERVASGCGSLDAHGRLAEKGILAVGYDANDMVNTISTQDSRIRTPSGARVGLTLTELRAIYGSKLADVKVDAAGPSWYGVNAGGNSLMFIIEDDKVSMMFAQRGPAALDSSCDP